MALGIWSFLSSTSRQIRWDHLLVWIAFLYLAVIAKRNIVLFFMVSVPLISANLSLHPLGGPSDGPCHAPSPRALAARYARYLLLTALLILTASDLYAHTTMHLRSSLERPLSPFRYPVHTTRLLNQALQDTTTPSPVVFNSIRFGGYLLRHCYPPLQVYIDGRLIIRSPAFFRQYLSVLDTPETFDRVHARYGITHAVVPTAFPDRYLRLAAYLYHNADWALHYADGAEALFVHTAAADADTKRTGAAAATHDTYTLCAAADTTGPDSATTLQDSADTAAIAATTGTDSAPTMQNSRTGITGTGTPVTDPATAIQDKKMNTAIARAANTPPCNAAARDLRLDQSSVVDSIADVLNTRWTHSPYVRNEALMHFARTLQTFGESRQARRVYATIGTVH
jgi:hypothetical protein